MRLLSTIPDHFISVFSADFLTIDQALIFSFYSPMVQPPGLRVLPTDSKPCTVCKIQYYRKYQLNIPYFLPEKYMVQLHLQEAQ